MFSQKIPDFAWYLPLTQAFSEKKMYVGDWLMSSWSLARFTEMETFWSLKEPGDNKDAAVKPY